jgi:hypothetical protein
LISFSFFACFVPPRVGYGRELYMISEFGRRREERVVPGMKIEKKKRKKLMSTSMRV